MSLPVSAKSHLYAFDCDDDGTLQTDTDSSPSRDGCRIQFSVVSVRVHPVILDDDEWMTLDWSHGETQCYDIEDFERKNRRRSRGMKRVPRTIRKAWISSESRVSRFVMRSFFITKVT